MRNVGQLRQNLPTMGNSKIMKTLINILLTTLILIAATYSNVLAQNDLPQGSARTSKADTDTISTLFQRLQTLYEADKYHDVLQLSEEIQNLPRLSKDQKQERLKYSIAAFKSLEYDNEADSIAKLFLKKDPFYVTTNDDPVPFQNVLNGYTTRPMFSVWMAGGWHNVEPFNDTIHTIIYATSKAPKYKITGYSVQLGFEYRPLKIVSISIAPSFVFYELNRTIQHSDIATFHYNETSTVFTLPLLVEAAWYRKRTKIVPSIYAGAQMKSIVYSEFEAYNTAGTYTSKNNDPQDNTDTKNKINYSLLGGLRFNYNHRRMTYFADLGGSIDMLPYNDPAKKYQNYDLLYHNFYISDVFRMIEYSIKIGIKINIKYKIIAKYNNEY